MEIEYKMIDPHELERAQEHQDTLVTDDVEITDAINQWFEDNGFLLPVYYVLREIDGHEVKAVVDGWKKVLYAREKGIEKIQAVEIYAGEEELTGIMIQLQRSGHNGLLALYCMAKALYPKHYKGQGYRSDLTYKELDKAAEGQDGRKLNIYERIGRDMGIKSGNKIKYILKVGDINPLHFERIEISRFSLLQAFQECKKEEAEFEPEVPKPKAPVYHTTMTPVPEFAKTDSTATAGTFDYTSTTTGEVTPGENTEQVESGTENAGEAHSNEHPKTVAPESNHVDQRMITVRGVCKECGQETEIEIDINQYL
jgi:hypothetical protein